MHNILNKYYYYSINKPIDICINRIANRFCHDIKYKGSVEANSFTFRKKEIDWFTIIIKDKVRYKVHGKFITYNNTTILKLTFSFLFDLIPIFIITGLFTIISIIDIVKSNSELYYNFLKIAGIALIDILFIYSIKKAGYDFLNELEFVLENPSKIKKYNKY